MVYVNGRFVPPEKAQIPVTDRAFLFADGVYEVIFGRAGRFAFWDLHMARLTRSAAELEIPLPLDSAGWLAVAKRLWSEGGDSGSIYLEVSRGAAPREHHFPDRIEPSTVAFIKPASAPESCLGPGVSAVLLEDQRWLRCDIKSVNLLPNVLAREEARRRGAREAILVRDGMLTEGAATNLFVVRQGELWTHPANHLVLAGITRHVILEEARRLDLKIRLEPYAKADLAQADEIFVTGTTSHLLPIAEIRDEWRAKGPGPITAQLHDAYWRRLTTELEPAASAAASAG